MLIASLVFSQTPIQNFLLSYEIKNVEITQEKNYINILDTSINRSYSSDTIFRISYLLKVLEIYYNKYYLDLSSELKKNLGILYDAGTFSIPMSTVWLLDYYSLDSFGRSAKLSELIKEKTYLNKSK
jgi:hypothetical protein